jgi:hypothetical protein
MLRASKSMLRASKAMESKGLDGDDGDDEQVDGGDQQQA